MQTVVTISIETWRLIGIITSFAIMCLVLGALTSKWNLRKNFLKRYKAGELIAVKTQPNEVDTFLKLTAPIEEVVNREYAIFVVKWSKRKNETEDELASKQTRGWYGTD